MGRHVRKGDMVIVRSGKHRGRKGKIVRVLVRRGRVCIEGIAVVKRHLKPGKDRQREAGGIYEKLGSIHLSNVQPIDPSTGKGTRVRFKKLSNGRKIRIAQRSGEELDQL